jgi:hypothetical protein
MKHGKEISFSQTTTQTMPDFSYSMRGKVISVTGLTLAQTSSIKEIEKVLRQVSHYHQGSIASYRILYTTIDGLGGEIRWDGERAEILHPRDPMN